MFLFIIFWYKNSSPALNSGIMGAQAVSLKVVGDKAAFYGCGLYGKQDTLLDQEIWLSSKRVFSNHRLLHIW